MYSVVLVATLGGGTAVAWHDHDHGPYGTCGVTYMCGCYGSGPGGALGLGFSCPGCASGGPGPGYGPPGPTFPGWGASGGWGAGYVPPPPVPFNPVPYGAAFPTGMNPPAPLALARSAPARPRPGPVETAAPAKIVVDTPPDARVAVGGRDPGPGGQARTFLTDALEPGREYSYPVRAEVVRDGVTLTATKEIRLRAGQEVRVVIDFPRATVSQK